MIMYELEGMNDVNVYLDLDSVYHATDVAGYDNQEYICLYTKYGTQFTVKKVSFMTAMLHGKHSVMGLNRAE